MRTWLVIVLGLTPLPAVAHEPLTPDQARLGWLDLFDGTTSFGWKTMDASTLQVHEGHLQLAAGTAATFSVPLPPIEHELVPPPPPLAPVKVGFRPHDTVPGWVQVRVSASQDQAAGLTALRVRPRKTTPLFTGHDLAGWTIYRGNPARERSVFQVTDAKELHVSNGPGDLQTTGQYADFLLQLECKTCGDGLNSGIFFRCIPGEYQNGYEAQIHNSIRNDDPTQPVDFGTGAIYRRVPARRVISRDHHDFTLTVLAVGIHIATWVDGYPTVNWRDERPMHPNPRQGSRTEAGAISIQGHDPTTDLLFKNIRIAE